MTAMPRRLWKADASRVTCRRRNTSYTAFIAAILGAILAGMITTSALASGRIRNVAAHGTLPGTKTHAASGLKYALTPVTGTAHVVCPPPADGHAACMSVVDPAATSTSSGFKMGVNGPLLEGGGEGGGIDPKELQEAYKVPTTGGSGQTVAIVDAFDDPNVEADLKTFRSHYGLSECTKTNSCFRKVNQKGEEANYPSDKYPEIPFSQSVEDWGLEISLDVEMVSAACAECHILLVEANNNESLNLFAADEEAEKLGATEISNSWGGTESTDETVNDKIFEHAGVPITASAGDYGSQYGAFYPAASRYVIAVGGTTLKKKKEGERLWEETVWSGSGSGCSLYEPKPIWQTDPICSKRTDNDIAAVADNEHSPVSVYDSYEYTEPNGVGTGKLGWVLVGGTSVGAPLVAGIEAHASATVRGEGAEAFYRHAAFDVLSGSNGSTCHYTYICNAEEGYDGPTGWGSPDGPSEVALKFTAIAGPTTGLTSTGANLNGMVSTTGLSTTYHFEYGPTESYGTSVPVPEGAVGSGATWQAVSRRISGLTPLATYHYRLVAKSSSGTVYSKDRTFTTMPWVIQSTPYPGPPQFASEMRGVSCISREACTAVGAREENNTDWGFAERWSGSEWKVQSMPKPAEAAYIQLYGVSCTSLTSCMAVGGWSTSTSPERPLAESWNGTEWKLQNAPYSVEWQGTILEDVSCASASACVAVGHSTESDGVGRVTLAERWNGTEWTIQVTPNPGGAVESYLPGVSCASASACTAVGYYASSTGSRATLAERWNGTEWSIQTTPNPPQTNHLTKVSCPSSTACTAVGGLSAERWNGTEWSIQTVPTVGRLTALEGVSCTSSTECWAVGNDESYALRWNGTEWSGERTAAVEEEVVERVRAQLRGVSCFSANACTAVGIDFGPLAEASIVGVPYVASRQATAVSEKEATLNGVVDPEGNETKYYFEYGTTGSFGSKTAEVNVGLGTGVLEEGKTLTGLMASTTYYYRIVAGNAKGANYGATKEFSTTGKPTAETIEATGMTETGGFMHGIVNPRGFETKYYFEYGPTVAYGTKTAEVNVGSGALSLAESSALTGLVRGTSYHYRIVATNSKGTVDGADRVLHTTATPYVETTQASGVNETAATANGVANPEGLEARYYFEYGTTTSYGSKTAEASAGSGVSNVEVKSTLGGLTSRTIYHYRLVASNSLGTVYGADEAFATGPWSWSITSTPNPVGTLNSSLAGISCSSITACTAVGEWSPNGRTTYKPLVERWNGGEWALQTAPAPTEKSTLAGVSCSNSSSCMAAGYDVSSSGTYFSLSESWNGSEWKTQPVSEPSGTLNSLLIATSCSSASACTAVGWYEASSGLEFPLAERWNGSSWSVQSMPAPSGAKATFPYAVSCPTSNACVVAGYYENSSSVNVPFAEQWNGSEWSVQSVPAPAEATATFQYGISCSSPTACTAVGQTYVSGASGIAPLAERWNGSTWSLQSPPSPAETTESKLTGVSCIVSTTCMAAGVAKNKAGKYITLAEHWNGNEWQVQTTPNRGEDSYLDGGVSCTSLTSCMAGGSDHLSLVELYD